MNRGVLAVTGASGFIGRRFIREAAARGYTLRVLGRQAVAEDGIDAAWSSFDLGDSTPFDPALLEGVDAVVHLAAYIPRDQRDDAEAETCFRYNALGTLRLLKAVRAAGVGRFVHTVSANAYLPGLEQPDETAQMLPFRRGAFYLASKVAQETFAAYFGQSPDLAVTALRLSSVYGAGQTGGVVPSFLRTLQAGETLQLTNGGRYGTDWVDVDDVVAALFIALEQHETRPLNVGSGVRVTLAEVADLLIRVTGIADARVEILPFDDPLDIGFPALDIGRIRRLGYAPAAMPVVLERLWASRNRVA